MKPQRPAAYPEVEAVRLVWLAIFVSVFSFLFYQRQGDVLLYGDAVAHINIARRIFDSKTPGILQLGTVWLPLPHLLILPFILSTRMWQTGTGGSIPSMAGYVFGVLGIFRLMRTITRSVDSAVAEAADPAEKAAGFDSRGGVLPWAAAILYGANPNLIYMQSTAMGESLYLAFFIWAVAHFAEFVWPKPADKTEKRESVVNKPDRSLLKCGLCLLAASLTRYDGWFLAAVLVVAAAFVAIVKLRSSSERATGKAIAGFILLACAGPILWIAYNAAVYRNPLEFANGPYSARAIEQKTATVNQAKGSLVAAGSYFLKAAELNVGEAAWEGRLWLLLAAAGSLAAIFVQRWRLALLLWAPLPFYACSIAYGSIPIFVPPWWPHSNYNVRYGLELLPVFALFVPLAISFLAGEIVKLGSIGNSWRRWQPAAVFLLVIGSAVVSYSAIWRGDPICFREASVNNRGRMALEKQLADWFQRFPPNATLLMYLGEHSGALENAGIPLRRVINEGNHRAWKQPYDPQGLWERALADPAAYSDFAIGFEGDPVWQSAREHHLMALVEIHTTGQAAAAIFPTHAVEQPR